MNVKLVRPTIQLKSGALDYRQEHFDNSELFDKIHFYEEWLEKVNNNSKIETVNPNWVLTDTFFCN